MLEEWGWTAAKGAALATKTYETAVGPKVALAYLADFRADDPNTTLSGEYQSEGRNILEAHGVLIPKTADAAERRKLFERFARGADLQVGQSYAARLLKL